MLSFRRTIGVFSPIGRYSSFMAHRNYNEGKKSTFSFKLTDLNIGNSASTGKEIPSPVNDDKNTKAEEAIEKLWETNKNISVDGGYQDVFEKYKLKRSYNPEDKGSKKMKRKSFGKSNDEFISKTSDQYKDFVKNTKVEYNPLPYNEQPLEIDDNDISISQLVSGDPLDNVVSQEKTSAANDSDDFLDGILDKSEKDVDTTKAENHESGDDPLDEVLKNSTSLEGLESESVPKERDDDEEGVKEEEIVHVKGGIGKKEYDINDLLRDDTLKPRIAELEDITAEDDDEDMGENTYIEDLNLDDYVLQRGNFTEAQRFLQDVSKFKTSEFPLEKKTKVVDMVKRARRILESHKASQEFWDEFVFLRQMNEFVTLAPIHFRPVLDPHVKDSIFLLHQSNPEEWTTAKLAQRFRIKKARIEAILLLKIDEHIRRKTKPWTVNMNGDEIDYLYGEFFGLSGNGHWMGWEDDRFTLEERRWRNARISLIDDEQEDLASLARMAVRIKPSWFEMPEQRPTGTDAYPDVYPDGEVIRGPIRKLWKKSKRKTEYIYIDISPIENFEEECKMFWMKHNGSMRHLTWEERRRVFRNTQFSVGTKGSAFVTQTTLTDPVIFPTDKDEESLLEEQKHPLVRNRRFETQKVFTENDMLRELDNDYKKIGRLILPAEQYVRGRMPWSVQQMLKKERATNIMDTLYRPLHDNFQ